MLYATGEGCQKSAQKYPPIFLLWYNIFYGLILNVSKSSLLEYVLKPKLEI